MYRSLKPTGLQTYEAGYRSWDNVEYSNSDPLLRDLDWGPEMVLISRPMIAADLGLPDQEPPLDHQPVFKFKAVFGPEPGEPTFGFTRRNAGALSKPRT